MSKIGINQKRFIKRVAKQINKPSGVVEPIEEYLAVYPQASRETARTNSSEILNSEIGKKTLSEFLERDFPKNKRSERLANLAHATKPFAMPDGTVVDIDDSQASLRSLELICKLSGDLHDGSVTNIDARSVNIQLDTQDVDRLSAVVKQMAELRASIQK